MNTMVLRNVSLIVLKRGDGDQLKKLKKENGYCDIMKRYERRGRHGFDGNVESLYASRGAVRPR